MRPLPGGDPAPEQELLSGISGLFHNSTFLAAVLAFFVAQIAKVFTAFKADKKWDWHKAVSPGGMPSSHTAFIVGLTVAVAQADGTNSRSFAICLVMSCIVMYDATGVRLQAGKHAAILHHIVSNLPDDHPAAQNYEKLKDVLGHTPAEVLAGALLGTVVGYTFQSLWTFNQ